MPFSDQAKQTGCYLSMQFRETAESLVFAVYGTDSKQWFETFRVRNPYFAARTHEQLALALRIF